MATLQFNKVDKTIIVPISDDTITIQEVYDQSQEWLAQPINFDVQAFISAGGKESLGGIFSVGITITLINDWRIKFEDRPGPTWVRTYVTGGNLVAINSFGNDPIAPSNFTSVEIRQSTSPSIVESGVSGLTPDEAQRLKDLWQVLGLDSGNVLIVTPSSRVAGDVIQSISGDPQTGPVTVTRSP